MLKQKQLFMHKPPETYGDCHRTAIACLLDRPLESVPHWGQDYWDDSGAFNRACDDWLMKHHRLKQYHVVYGGTLQEVLDALEGVNPGSVYLLCGLSANGTAHSVIAGQGKILWDPSRDNSGIVAPIEGYYWVTLLVPHYHFPSTHDQT